MSARSGRWIIEALILIGVLFMGVNIGRVQMKGWQDHWYAQHPIQREHYIRGMEIHGACFIEPPENGTAYFSDNTIVLTEQQCSIIPTRGAK